MVNTLPVTASLQDYLEVILSLSEEGSEARVTDIACRMNIAKPSVIKALSILKQKGLIRQARYGPVQLTDKGKKYARKIMYRHEILRYFLREVLGVPPEIAERDACLLEHDLSSRTFECLVEFLKERGRG